MSPAQKFKRHVYLNLKSLEEARKIFLNRFDLGSRLQAETIPVDQALDRITASPIFARFSSPGFHAAAMDGIAVKAEDTYGASADKPIRLKVGKQAFYLNTGHLLPEGTNAVIMIEDIEALDDNKVQIEAAAFPWQHVRKVGEDIVATEMILPQNSRLGPYELGAVAASGHQQVAVKKRPEVHIIPTGSELIAIGKLTKEPEPGQMVEFNSVMLKALVARAGGEPVVYDIVPDDYKYILTALREAVEGKSDLVIINAGSSAGSEDYTAAAIAELGEVLVHGVTIMPGKPTILGAIKDKPVIGNPGYPVSAVISFEQFAQPVLAGLLSIMTPQRPRIEVTPSQAFPSRLGLEEFLRVKVGRIGAQTVAVPLPRGAGSITTLTRADGIIRIPAESEGVGTEEKVEAELLRPLEEVEGTLVIIGSHDNTLDVLADFITRRDFSITLSSGNVGSLGGLLTLKKGFSHLAGTHLLDTDTGEYNISYLKKYLTGLALRLVNLVTRQQGFIVPKGNPKQIKGFDDLTRKDVVLVNRQPGSGTRILLDYHLEQLGVDPAQINGYQREEFTHMAVAVDVLSGRADTGVGILAAARALGLDFVPVTIERYDLVIPEKFWEDRKIKILLEVIRSDEFKNAVLAMGGYGVEQTGEILWTWDGVDR
ncbi:MAG: molybdopterin biosynthesis protein [Deltaproteobacteria bacterium]|nr:molybdopterin biosynthesis protein [Deltaproteobacteria bacterium]